MRFRALGALGFALVTGTCDGGLEPEPICGRGFVGVCGTLRFTGSVPDATETVFVLAFPRLPQGCEELLTRFPPAFRPFPPLQYSPPFPETATYELPLPPDRYEWVLAVWKKLGGITLTLADTAIFRVAGDYRDPANPAQPAAVIVPSGGAVGGVDFTVDLANLRTVPDVMPCPSEGQ